MWASWPSSQSRAILIGLVMTKKRILAKQLATHAVCPQSRPCHWAQELPDQVAVLLGLHACTACCNPNHRLGRHQKPYNGNCPCSDLANLHREGCKCQIILFSLKDHSVPLRALPRHCFRGSSAQETMPAWSAYLEQAAWRKELSKRKLSAKNKWTFLCQVYKSAYIHHGCSGVESLGASRHGHQY